MLLPQPILRLSNAALTFCPTPLAALECGKPNRACLAYLHDESKDSDDGSSNETCSQLRVIDASWCESLSETCQCRPAPSSCNVLKTMAVRHDPNNILHCASL